MHFKVLNFISDLGNADMLRLLYEVKSEVLAACRSDSTSTSSYFTLITDDWLAARSEYWSAQPDSQYGTVLHLLAAQYLYCSHRTVRYATGTVGLRYSVQRERRHSMPLPLP